jgi:hypothetical protein
MDIEYRTIPDHYGGAGYHIFVLLVHQKRVVS